MTSERTTIASTAAVLLLGIAFAGTAHAERYEVSIGGGTSALPSKSIDSLTSATSYGIVDLEVGMQLVNVPIIGHGEVALRWDSGGFTGTSFGRIDSELSLDTVTALWRAKHRLNSRLTGFGEVGVGLQWAHLYLDDSGSGLARRLEDYDKAVASTLGAGMDLRLSSKRSLFDLSLRARLNYRAIAPLNFEATPMSEGSDDLLLSTQSASLGSVNTSGLAFSAGLVGRF